MLNGVASSGSSAAFFACLLLFGKDIMLCKRTAMMKGAMIMLNPNIKFKFFKNEFSFMDLRSWFSH